MSTTPPPQAPSGAAGFAASLLVLPQHNWKWFLLRGLIAIALGIIALFFPGFTLLTFAMLFAAFSFADGILSLIAGIRGASEHRDRWGALVFSGITGILVGVVFFIWPLLATATSSRAAPTREPRRARRTSAASVARSPATGRGCRPRSASRCCSSPGPPISSCAGAAGRWS